MHSVIGVPYYLLAEVSEDSISFAKETGYLLDAEDVANARKKYAEAVMEILGCADAGVILESYEEDGMYVVSQEVDVKLKIVGGNIAYIKAVPFVDEVKNNSEEVEIG